ncbi:MAG: DUF3341 domain-containing protein [Gammaproteobacteria bacterium]|nr:DUF3341 domain-containing protein [Gammaproteobacteria bacterium]
MKTEILGIFQYEDDFLDAAKKLRADGFDDLTLMSPIPMHQVEEILQKKKPVIRRFTLGGAILGALSGFALAAGTALVFILPTGGRPIITMPPFLVISYELTILFGVLATLVGFHIASGLPAWHDKPYRMETNIDRFSILIACQQDSEVGKAEQILSEAGAEEISKAEVSA